MMNRARWLRAVVGVLALVALTGCMTRVAYEGVRLPPSEEAVLTAGEYGPNGGLTSVFIVDGRMYQSMARGVGAYTVYLRSGRHSLTIAYDRPPYRAMANLWVDAAAGGAYVAKAGLRDGRVNLWIEDSATGQVVGGVDENPIPLTSDFKKERGGL